VSALRRRRCKEQEAGAEDEDFVSDSVFHEFIIPAVVFWRVRIHTGEKSGRG